MCVVKTAPLLAALLLVFAANSPLVTALPANCVNGASSGSGFEINECVDLTKKIPRLFSKVKELCKEHALNTSHFPTKYGNNDTITSSEDAFLRLLDFEDLLAKPDNELCHPQLRQYICRMIFPRCINLSPCMAELWWRNTNYIGPAKIFPCKDLCMSIKHHCSCGLNIDWPDWADCKDPEPNDGILFHYQDRCEPLKYWYKAVWNPIVDGKPKRQ